MLFQLGAFTDQSEVSTLPAWFLNQSEVVALPAGCMNQSEVSALPAGCMSQSEVSALPAGYMSQSEVVALPAGYISAFSGLQKIHGIFPTLNNTLRDLTDIHLNDGHVNLVSISEGVSINLDLP